MNMKEEWKMAKELERDENRKKLLYVAIKVVGLKHWVWFKAENTKEENHRFKGEKGWGEGGALTSIDVDVQEIKGRLESDELQY